MALPIRLESLSRDAHEEARRLDEAPVEHAEALLAAYNLLQELHDRGLLDILRGALHSSDFILDSVVETAKTPEAIRIVRNLILLSKVFANIEPGLLDRIAGSVPEGLAQISSKKTDAPGLFSLLQRSNNPDCRRGIAFTAGLLESLGKRLTAEHLPEH
jgi:uncharacterized protein YjgD (DUF1641 family)